VAEERIRTALLVDWGGVLTTNLFASFGAFCTAEGIAPETLAGMLGVEAASLIDRMFAHVGPDPAMLAAVGAARAAGIRTGLVSNSWGTRRYDRAMLEALFDGVVISGEVGMRKPAPEMYRLGAERAGTAPEDCVYVDDLPFNLPPAAELGMATVHHTDTAATIPELERLLGVSLASPVRT
jgi:epoxide hydrolase-like predicted phosphatase